MSYSRPQQPNEVRTRIQAAYERYASGQDLRPKVRLGAPPEAFPRKTRRTAELLEAAWQIIDEDDEYFEDATLTLLEGAMEQIQSGRTEKSGYGVVITRVGRHAVKMAVVDIDGDQPKVTLGEFPASKFTEELNGVPMPLPDGREVCIVDGEAQGQPDAAIVRRSNASLIFKSPTVESPAA